VAVHAPLLARGAVAAGGIALRLTGWARGPVWPILAIAPAYVIFVALLTVVIERREESRAWRSSCSLWPTSPRLRDGVPRHEPDYYGRALLLSLLALQLMQMFFLRSPALTVVVASSAVPRPSGRRGPSRHLHRLARATWMLSVFLVVVPRDDPQASANQRLAGLVDLFAAAQQALHPHLRRIAQSRADAITVLGRAYNHMRSELAEIAFTDNLTSCLNRNGFEYALDQMIDGAARDGRRSRSSPSTSITSRASTTRRDTSWATWCCARWRCCCSTLHAPETSSDEWEERNS
jgi:hypothetical protein